MSPRLLAPGATLAPVKERSRVAAERLVDRKSDPKLPEMGARLALTRRALDLTDSRWPRLLGSDMPTWGTYEAGTQRILPDQALKLSAYQRCLDHPLGVDIKNNSGLTIERNTLQFCRHKTRTEHQHHYWIRDVQRRIPR
jgi:hypothetical protein